MILHLDIVLGVDVNYYGERIKMKLTDIFKVECNKEFKVLGYYGTFKIYEYTTGVQYLMRSTDGSNWENADLHVVYELLLIAPECIIFKDNLSVIGDKEIEQLKACILLEYFYIAKDSNGVTILSYNKPTKDNEEGKWYNKGKRIEVPPTWPIYDLVDWDDEDPFDIADFLKSYEVINKFNKENE